MTNFVEREKEFEARFKHDQEFRFKVTARRNRLLGLWAAGQLGLSGNEAQDYAKSVVDAEFAPGGDSHVVAKIAADFSAKGVGFTASQIRFELDRFAEQAKNQLMTE